MSYDQKCYDLAMRFLEDIPMDEALRKKHADTMAKDIQIAVENYIADEIVEAPQDDGVTADELDDNYRGRYRAGL